MMNRSSILFAISVFTASAYGTGMTWAADVSPETKQALLNLTYNCSGPLTPRVVIDSCSRLLNIGLLDEPKLAAITYNNRGSAYVREDEPEKALADFNEAIRLHPDYATAYFNIGKLQTASGFFDRAIEHLDQAIELEPAYIDAYIQRGVVRAKLRQFDLALRDFEAALRLQPDNKLAETNRARAYQDLKETRR